MPQGLGNEGLAREVAGLIMQLTTYGVRLPEAIHEGWRVLYDISWRDQEVERRSLFETIQSAKINLSWAILLVKKHTGWEINTDGDWHIPHDLQWHKEAVESDEM